MKKKQVLCMAICALILLQLLPFGQSLALVPSDPGRTVPGDISEVVTVNETASYVRITDSSNVVITPGADGNYTGVPLDSKIKIYYEFILPNDDGKDPVTEYSYISGDTFKVQLPEPVQFDVPPAGTPLWTDPGKTTSMGLLTLDGAGLVTITFNEYVSNHSDMTGWFEVEGTFKPGVTGSSTPVDLTIGTKTITITPADPPAPPVELGLAKQGAYNAALNEIAWTVTVTVPEGSTASGVSLEDVYGSNQTYKEGSFTVNSEPVLDTGLLIDQSLRTIIYAFPGAISGVQTISYKTVPAETAFGAETGLSSAAERTNFQNTATVKVNDVINTDPVTATVAVDWISKSGSPVNNFETINWTVYAGINGQSIPGAMITDTLPAGLELVPGSVRLGGSSGTLVTQSIEDPLPAGQYRYDSATRTLSYNAGNLDRRIILFYSTRVIDRTSYLNSNVWFAFRNDAELSWDQDTLTGFPADTASVGVGSGGLLSKTGGPAANYDDPVTRNISWTITVNRNAITMPEGTTVTDTVPAGQRFLPGTFAVRDSAGNTVATEPSSYSDNSFSYSFQQAFSGRHTITFETEITNLASLYANRTAGFNNSASLTGTGVSASTASFTKSYYSQIVEKTVKNEYDYRTRTMTWQITINRNRLPMTNAVVTDSIPAGMEFLPGTFSVTPAVLGEAEGALSYTVNGLDNITDKDSFAYAFPNTIAETYTITFDTRLKEAFLLTQENKTFRNEAVFKCDEMPASVTAAASQIVENPIVTKTGDYISGADYIEWQVLINANRLTLTDVSLTDDLQAGLLLDTDTIKLYRMEQQANGTHVKSGEALPAEFYTVDYDAASNRFIFGFTQTISEAYQLEFVTDVLVNSMNVNNAIRFTGTGVNADAASYMMVISVSNQGAGGGGSSGSITIRKLDAADLTRPLGGARFALLDINGVPIPGREAVTDDSGSAAFTGLLFKTYYVREIEPPAGYLLSGTAQKFRLTSGSESFSYTAENLKAVGAVSFAKTTTGGTPLNGGMFTLTGLDYAGNAVSLTASSVNGTVTFTDVPLGEDYTIRETRAPSGYSRSNIELRASVSYNADKTGVITSVDPDVMENRRLPGRSNIEIMKTNSAGEPLEGAEFTLYDGGGNVVFVAVSGPDGKAVFTNLPLGKYTVKETKAPAMYKLNEKAIEIELDTPDAVLRYNVIDEKGLPDVPKSGDPATAIGWALLIGGLLFAALPLLKRKGADKQK